MDDCIFCKIVVGDIPGKILYQDEHTMAFLDAFPLVEGHTLVIPKGHYPHIQDLPQDVTQAWMLTVQRVSEKLQAATNADALTIGLNNGKAAGQLVPHLHMHLLPRYGNDGGGTLHSVIKKEDQASVDDVFDKLKSAF